MLVIRRLVLLSLCLAATIHCSAAEPGLIFYLQLVRGNDQSDPPTESAKPIGPLLSEKLSSVFKWKDYWELKRERILVKQGATIRKRLSPEHEVEVELPSPDTLRIRIFLNGRLTRTRTQPVREAFCIAGGNEGPDQSWFIIVRRDEPQQVEDKPHPATQSPSTHLRASLISLWSK
jgi:hypothetical protein